ncbi:MAG: radical SAM protein [Deltaproteobacteria bacterium]|nr:radical SAM protein [Deltaproteobacteria bacterium]
MRIVLVYPPPWKIPSPGEPPDGSGDGPPAEYRPGDLDADFFQMPYGVLSLAAQAMRAGHQVKVLNLSPFAWTEVEETLGAIDADLYGLSCYTANRRGVFLAACAIRCYHPVAHIVVGGPHATALPREMLAHHPDIDTVVCGEGEQTLLELAERLVAGRSTAGLPGTAFRSPGGAAQLGPARRPVRDLDELASVHEHFATHLVLTSRGCPFHCTFCAAAASWGKGYRTHSVPYVLDAIEQALARVPVKMLQVKDDTFSVDRRRVLALCRGIRARGLRFAWSCDSRADLLDEELLREMRLAGCERLSLGVESGSPQILRSIGKEISLEAVLRATELCKRVGIQVRYFMMLGNRGESTATVRESLALIERAQPHQYLFACLSVYPGTADFLELERRGVLGREAFFSDDFQELKMPFDASEKDTAFMSELFARHRGIRDCYRPGVRDCEAVLEMLGDHAGAHLDLGGACYREGDYARAERHVRRALELGHPLPGLAHNYLACIAAARGDLAAMEEELACAAADPQHAVLLHNWRAVRAWLDGGGPGAGPLPELAARHGFELLERTVQPMLPGPLPAGFADWA